MTDYTIPRRCRIAHREKHKSGGSLTVYAEDANGDVVAPQVDANVPFYEIDFDERGELIMTRLNPRTGLPLH
jgi:hypothetical protein